MKSITDMITIPLGDFDTNWGYEYFLGVVKKYRNNVVAFKITDKHFYVILKGKIKFFIAKINMDKRIIYRIPDFKIGIFCEDKKLVVLDQEEFDNFYNKEILKSLKEEKQE